MIKVAINGFGRIGRAFFKLAQRSQNIKIVAINDLADKKDLEYLLEHDSVYGLFKADLTEVSFFQEKDPRNLPWRELDIDVVVESTGHFKEKDQAQAHLEAGAKRVVISAPSKTAEIVIVGINEEKLKESKITSNASCTTNAITAAVYALDKTFRIKNALLSTVHSFTSSQSLVDSPNKKDPKRGRAATLNIIPTSTGASIALSKVYPIDNFKGLAIRVPTPAGSLAQVSVLFENKASEEQINDTLKKASEDPRFRGTFAVSEEPLVSTDILGRPKSSIADLTLTQTSGLLANIFLWYDNEIGYTYSLLKHVEVAGELERQLD